MKKVLEETKKPVNTGSLTTEQAAEKLHVRPKTLTRWIREGRLPAIKVGKRWLIHRTTVNQVLNGVICCGECKKVGGPSCQ